MNLQITTNMKRY